MSKGSLVSHLAVAVAAFGLGWALFGAGHPGAKLDRMAGADPVAAFSEILAIPDAHERARALLDFFATADPAWAEPLRAAVNQPDGKLMLDETGEQLFASWWVRFDPKAAFEQRADPPWGNRHPWLREVVSTWTAADPVRAAQAADGLPENPDLGRVEAARALVDHWWDQSASVDPAPLLAVLQKLEVMPRAGAVQRLLAVSIEKRGLDATEEFVETLPRPDELGISVENEIYARYAQALVERDVDRAIRWGAEHGSGRDGSGILRHMAFSWGLKDGPRAMEWAMNLPPQDMDRAGTLLRAWLSFQQASPQGAEEWLLAHEPTEALDPIYRRFLSGTARTDSQKALAIASRIQDPAVRDRMLASVGAGWMRSDPEAAKRWLDTVELAPELEERVRRAERTEESPPPFAPAG